MGVTQFEFIEQLESLHEQIVNIVEDRTKAEIKSNYLIGNFKVVDTYLRYIYDGQMPDWTQPVLVQIGDSVLRLLKTSNMEEEEGLIVC